MPLSDQCSVWKPVEFLLRAKKSKVSDYCLGLTILTQGTEMVRYQNEICGVGEVIDVSN
jgi:hypothetical protein